MQKTQKILGFVSLFMSLFTAFTFVQFLIESSKPDAGWVDLGFMLISIILLFFAIILTIPFLILLSKLKFVNMKFYTYTHLSFIILSLFGFIFSMNL